VPKNNPLIVLLGTKRDLLPVVYILAAFIERDEVARVSDESIREAATLLANERLSVDVERCPVTSDINVALDTCPSR
tara:strand:- start:814 stop:1044 length:231 start_codon:yes stop_codon:yes gene_type:complete